MLVGLISASILVMGAVLVTVQCRRATRCEDKLPDSLTEQPDLWPGESEKYDCDSDKVTSASVKEIGLRPIPSRVDLHTSCVCGTMQNKTFSLESCDTAA